MPTTATMLSIASLVSTAALGIVGFFFTRRLERLKADLNQKIESQKIDWALNAKLSEIRFSRLHEKQFEACRQLYSLLVNVHNEFYDIYKRYLTNVERTEAEKIEAIQGALVKLQDFLRESGVLFPSQLSDRINALNNEIRAAWNAIGYRDNLEIFFDAGDKYFKQFPPILEEVRHLVQELMGVSPNAARSVEH
jgi:hypothetical protein